MTSVRKALLLSLVERYLLLVLAFGTNIVLARLLMPEQIGVYSVSMAVLGIAQAVRDFGVGSYLIQERELSRGKIQAAFGVSLLLGACMFVVALLASSAVAAYYQEPRMAATLQITSLNFLLLPFCTISLSLLRREMRFRRLLYVTIVAAALGAATSVLLAAAGGGENSLAIGAVVTNLVTGLGSWLARSDKELLLPNLREWRSVLSFGGKSSIAGVVTSVSMDANDLIVGKVLGFHSVAMLSRAQGLMSLFHRDLMGAVRNVALPAFAGAHRRGESIADPFLRSVALVTVFAWPFYGLMSVYSLEIIDLLFGHQWLPAAPLVPIFCGAGAVAALNALTPNLLVAVGRIDLLMRVELLMQPLRVLLIFVAAVVFKTLQACAFAYLASAIITLPVMWWFKRQCVHDDMAALKRYFLTTASVSAAIVLPALIHVSWIGWSRSTPIAIWQWTVVCLLGVVGGVITVKRLTHPLATEPIFQKLVGVFVGVRRA